MIGEFKGVIVLLWGLLAAIMLIASGWLVNTERYERVGRGLFLTSTAVMLVPFLVLGGREVTGEVVWVVLALTGLTALIMGVLVRKNKRLLWIFLFFGAISAFGFLLASGVVSGGEKAAIAFAVFFEAEELLLCAFFILLILTWAFDTSVLSVMMGGLVAFFLVAFPFPQEIQRAGSRALPWIAAITVGAMGLGSLGAIIAVLWFFVKLGLRKEKEVEMGNGVGAILALGELVKCGAFIGIILAAFGAYRCIARKLLRRRMPGGE